MHAVFSWLNTQAGHSFKAQTTYVALTGNPNYKFIYLVINSMANNCFPISVVILSMAPSVEYGMTHTVTVTSIIEVMRHYIHGWTCIFCKDELYDVFR